MRRQRAYQILTKYSTQNTTVAIWVSWVNQRLRKQYVSIVTEEQISSITQWPELIIFDKWDSSLFPDFVFQLNIPYIFPILDVTEKPKLSYFISVSKHRYKQMRLWLYSATADALK